MPAWVYVHHVHAGVCRDQQVSEALALELQKVLRHLVWLLRNEPRSSTRAASHLNCWALSSPYADSLKDVPKGRPKKNILGCQREKTYWPVHIFLFFSQLTLPTFPVVVKIGHAHSGMGKVRQDAWWQSGLCPRGLLLSKPIGRLSFLCQWISP